MSQSRKKNKGRSRQPSYGSPSKKYNQKDSAEVLSKLDNLRSSAKVEKKKIVVDNSQRNRFIAFAIIVVVGMSGLVILNQSGLFSTSPTNPNTNYTGKPPQMEASIGGFAKDTAATLEISDGKIPFLYMGGEFCPYCAMERWAIVMALEQFGSFTKTLNTVSSTEGQIGTYTFVGSAYSSSKIDFQPVELLDLQTHSLETPTSAQQNTMNKYDSSGSIPFMVIGGIYVKISAGASLNYNDFKGKTFDQINGEVTSKLGILYQEIHAESINLVSVMNLAITQMNNMTATTTTTGLTNTTSG